MNKEDIIKDLQRMHTYWLERNEGHEYRACRNAIILIEAQARVVEAAKDFHEGRTRLPWQSAELVHLANLLAKALHDLAEGEKG